MKPKELAKFIDHTNVKPTARERDIKKLCEEAKKYGFHSVCVTPSRVKLAKKFLKGSKIKVITVIGFPFGFTTPATKAFETKEAVKNGADEIDMVVNIGAVKDHDWDLVLKDIKEVVKAAKPKEVKVILEVGFLTKAEIIKTCKLAKQAGAKFVKTATGYGPRGAKITDIKLMRKAVGKEMGVKASGGIRDFKKALSMIQAGATRIGSSNGVSIIKGKKGKEKY